MWVRSATSENTLVCAYWKPSSELLTLVGPNYSHSTNFWIYTVELVSMAMPIIITLLIEIYFM